MRERRRVIIRVGGHKGDGQSADGHRADVSLTSAEVAEILAALHCRNTALSRRVFDRLSRASHAAPPARGGTEPPAE